MAAVDPTPVSAPTPTPPPASEPAVVVEVRGGVADVRLNRPAKLNALDGAMFRALADTCARLRARPEVRVVVLSGAGRAFCAGLDFGAFQTMTDSTGGRAMAADILADDDLNLGQRAVVGWSRLEVPVIAAVHGPCLGGGLQLALSADLRVVAPDASLAALEIRWGLVPDVGGSQALARLAGADVALDLCLTGRTITGAQAHALGLATRLAADPHAAALELAAEIAARSPAAVRAGKRLLTDATRRTADEQLAVERRESSGLVGGPQQVEAVMAFFQKRPPVFPDPSS